MESPQGDCYSDDHPGLGCFLDCSLTGVPLAFDFIHHTLLPAF